MARIVYCDGTAFEGEARDAPVKDVALIKRGDCTLYGKDFYIFTRGRWTCTDSVSAFVQHHRLGSPVLHGGDMDDDDWGRLFVGEHG